MLAYLFYLIDYTQTTFSMVYVEVVFNVGTNHLITPLERIGRLICISLRV